MSLARELTNSFTEIGQSFGGRTIPRSCTPVKKYNNFVATILMFDKGLSLIKINVTDLVFC